jgi:ATP-binding cassette, subfamily B, bacterial
VMLHRHHSLLPYMFRQWRILMAIGVLSLFSSTLTALQPWPMKILVDYALGQQMLPPLLEAWMGALSLAPTAIVLLITAAAASLGLFAINSALDVGLSWAWTFAGQRMVYDLAADIYHKLLGLSLRFHSQHSVGDLLGRLSTDTYSIYTLAQSLLISPAQQLLKLATMGLIAWSMDPGLTLLALLVAPGLGCSALFFGNRLKQQSRSNRDVQSKLTSFVHQTLSAIPVVQAYGSEDRNRQLFHRLTEDAVTSTQRATLVRNIFQGLNGLVTVSGTALILYVGGQKVLSGTLTLGSLLVFLEYLRSMQNAFHHLLGTYANLKSAEANMDRILEVVEAKEGVWEAPDAQPVPPRPRQEQGRIRLENVTFGYEAGNPVLRNINLAVQPGEVIALVGRTGAGKSSLVSLIPRFNDPGEGRVLFDGIDVRTLRLDSLRSQIAVVLQDPFLLPLTIADNIAYSRPGASRDEIVAAAVAARADEFIRQLPEGYDTVLAERGATLSGGERQRLAVARALLKNAPVLILDEPTSALDLKTEGELVAAMKRLMAGRTTFIITHRLSIVDWADRIVVLEDGQIVEEGTQAQLLAMQRRYWRYYDLQSAEKVEKVLA